MRLSVCLCLGVVGVLARCRGEVLGLGNASASLEQVDDNLLESEPTGDDNNSLQELCSTKHTSSCIKLYLIRGLERLAQIPSLELLPGLNVHGNLTSLQEVSRSIISGQLDEALLRSLTGYLTSLRLTVKVLDGGVVQRIKEVGEAFTQDHEDTAVTGRRKRYGSTMMMAGMMSGGTMLALSMSAIAMLAGKALMTALLSLMLSGMSAMKGGGGGGEKTTYEIIHGGHDIKHRSVEALHAESMGSYPFYMPHPAARRNLLIPLNRR